MTLDKLNQDIGNRTRLHGDFAEKNFNDHINRWVGSKVDFISAPYPDLDKVDLKSKLPSYGDTLGMVPRYISLNWQIKHTVTKPRPVKKKIANHETFAFRANLDKKTVKGLRERTWEDNDPLTLAFGVKKELPSGVSLMDVDVYEAFDWYALDLQQYFAYVEEDVIYIPLGNRLNLISFTMLWASHWVKKFYRPLRNEALFEHRSLRDFTERVYRNSKEVASEDEVKYLQEELQNKIPGFLKDLSIANNERRQIATALGLGVSLEDICQKLRISTSLEQLSTYCPESLYGTASLWLFSRSYWTFMSTSSFAVDHQHRQMNQRILPVRHDLNATPRLLWALLYCVVQLYDRLGVNIAIVRPNSEKNIGADISVYGGGIGHLPYISLSDDGLGWTQETISKGDLNSHRDFFAESPFEIILDQNSGIRNIPTLNLLPSSQLKLIEDVPVLFFASENTFIKHPSKLWENTIL